MFKLTKIHSLLNNFIGILKKNSRNYIQKINIYGTRFDSSCRFFEIGASYVFLGEENIYLRGRFEGEYIILAIGTFVYLEFKTKKSEVIINLK